MSQQTCPYLVTVDQNYNQGPPVEYPSFENRCSASGEKDSLLFPHQATFCLSNGHRMCPLFKAARNSTGRTKTQQTTQQQKTTQQKTVAWQPVSSPRQAANNPPETPQQNPFEAGTEPFIDTASFISGEMPAGVENAFGETEWLDNRRKWGWIGAGVVFVTVLLFGGLTAAWAGWNFANAQMQTQPGQVSLAEPMVTATEAPALPYVVWTATSPAGAVPMAQPTAQANLENPSFPAAVTATTTPAGLPAAVVPVNNVLAGDPQNSADVPVIVLQPPSTTAVQVPPGAQTLPNIQVEIPTRREIPTVDISINLTEAAVVELTSTPTETPTPLGTPVVIFGPDSKLLKSGECTKVRWTVKNVKEVYYDNLGVNGTDEREECLNQKDGVYSLRVILPNGETQVYTTTVTMEIPTPTPTPTWTFTPEPVFTPTWTPVPNTPTPTPNTRRGVAMSVQGGTQHTCASNSPCSIGLLVSNTGDQIDNLTVGKLAGEVWSPLLCRADGVCGDQLPLISVGPGNTVYIELRLALPADATSGQQQSYQFIALSDGSGATVTSQSVTVEVLVQ